MKAFRKDMDGHVADASLVLVFLAASFFVSHAPFSCLVKLR